MDTVNPFDELQLPPNATVALKEGINVDDLTSGTGTIFEVDDTLLHEKKEKDEQEPFHNHDHFWNKISLSSTQGDDNSGEDTTPFSHLEKSMTDLTGDNGVMKKVIELGMGPVVPEGGAVRVHYNGYLEYADEPYDSTRLRNSALKVRLGQGEVIPGLDIGIATMKKREIAQFLVKPEYAFGKMGCPPRIPPDATILFEVELLSYINDKPSDSYNSMPEEFKEGLTFSEIIKVAKSEKDIGNEAFDLKKYGKAASHYSKGIRSLEPVHLKDSIEEDEWKDILIKLYLNLSIANLKQCKSGLAIRHCRRVLELDSKNIKAMFRLGQAYMQLSEWSLSKQQLLNALRLSPNNAEIRHELETLQKKVQQFQLLEKGMYSKMFKENQDKERDMKPAGLEERSTATESMREKFKKQILLFKKSFDQQEIVLPYDASPDEVECIVQLAREAELLVELGKDESYSVKITKPLKQINIED